MSYQISTSIIFSYRFDATVCVSGFLFFMYIIEKRNEIWRLPLFTPLKFLQLCANIGRADDKYPIRSIWPKVAPKLDWNYFASILSIKILSVENSLKVPKFAGIAKLEMLRFLGILKYFGGTRYISKYTKNILRFSEDRRSQSVAGNPKYLRKLEVSWESRNFRVHRNSRGRQIVAGNPKYRTELEISRELRNSRVLRDSRESQTISRNSKYLAKLETIQGISNYLQETRDILRNQKYLGNPEILEYLEILGNRWVSQETENTSGISKFSGI